MNKKLLIYAANQVPHIGIFYESYRENKNAKIVIIYKNRKETYEKTSLK